VSANYVALWSKAVWDAEALSATEKLVLLAHTRYADFNTGGNCRPGASRIARDCSIAAKTVVRIRVKLEGDWLAVVGERGGPARKGGTRRATTYQLTTPLIGDRAPLVIGDPKSLVGSTNGHRGSPIERPIGDPVSSIGDRESPDWGHTITPPSSTYEDQARFDPKEGIRLAREEALRACS
jgi:hypothetical protein